MKNLAILILLLLCGSYSFSTQIYSDVEFDKRILYVGVPALLVSFAIDDEVNKIVQSNKSQFQDYIWENITHLGSPFVVAGGALGYVYGYFTKNEKLAKSSILAVQSATIASLIVLPIKYITQRERPSKEDKLSFPSAHSAIAFSFWGSYAEEYNKGLSKYLFYTIPVLVGYSRLYLEKHWLSDVVAGALIGLTSIYIAKRFTNFLSVRYNLNIFIDISSYRGGISYYF
ncbi:MAG: phosphatase PAP2 family protein [Aquificae bacterium]|nr:phosphatase PAP2 family protein [Aquificota bacterium]